MKRPDKLRDQLAEDRYRLKSKAIYKSGYDAAHDVFSKKLDRVIALISYSLGPTRDVKTSKLNEALNILIEIVSDK